VQECPYPGVAGFRVGRYPHQLSHAYRPRPVYSPDQAGEESRDSAALPRKRKEGVCITVERLRSGFSPTIR
jgi:hypothetical protein